MNLKITCMKDGAEAFSFHAAVAEGCDANSASEEFTDVIRKSRGEFFINAPDAITGEWVFVNFSKFDAVKVKLVEAA